MKILKLPTVKERCGLSRSSIYAFAKEGKFPSPVKLSKRSVGWLESEINSWLEQRAELRGGE
jgi:prophage regulatory protein